MSEGRRFLLVCALVAAGLGMVALAGALDAWWPLFLTPVPYAGVPWLLTRENA